MNPMRIIYLILLFIEYVLAYRFVGLFNRAKKQIPAPVVMLLSLALLILTQFVIKNKQYPSNKMPFIFLFICITCLFFHMNLLRTVITAGFYFSLIYIIDFILFWILGTFFFQTDYTMFITHLSDTIYLAATLIGRVLLICCFYLIRKFTSYYASLYDSFSGQPASRTVYLLILALFGIPGSLFAVYWEASDANTAFIYILYTFLITFLCVAFIFRDQRFKEKERQNALQVKAIFMEESQRKLNDYYLTQQKIYHDIHNNLAVLSNLLTQQQYDSAKNYLSAIIAPIEQLSNTVITGNSSIDFILNAKKEEAAKQSIAFSVKAPPFPDGEDRISDKDICTILFNLLDNALEACCLITTPDQPRFIRVNMQYAGSILHIKIENSCRQEPTGTFPHYVTSKANPQAHGFGLRSVEAVVEKYSGTMEAIYADLIFTIMIALF